MSYRNQSSEFDNNILNLCKETKLFMKSNDELIVTQADNAKRTVQIEKSKCNTKMKNIIDDITTYKILNYNPTKTVRNKFFRLLKKKV